MSRLAPLAAESVSKALGGVAVLQGVSLDVYAGHIHALVGLNGAGKTTLMRILLGMLTPDTGLARLFGGLVHDARAPLWARVGQMVETPFAYPELTAHENAYCSARLHGLERAAAGAAASRIVSDLGLDPYASRRAGRLSQGNRQRVGLAAALVQQPDVLVLDEPTNALDPRGVIVLRRLLQEAAGDRGAAILVSSHHLDEVSRMADRISVLHRGSVIGTLEPGSADLECRFFDLVLQSDLDEDA